MDRRPKLTAMHTDLDQLRMSLATSPTERRRFLLSPSAGLATEAGTTETDSVMNWSEVFPGALEGGKVVYRAQAVNLVAAVNVGAAVNVAAAVNVFVVAAAAFVIYAAVAVYGGGGGQYGSAFETPDPMRLPGYEATL